MRLYNTIHSWKTCNDAFRLRMLLYRSEAENVAAIKPFKCATAPPGTPDRCLGSRGVSGVLEICNNCPEFYSTGVTDGVTEMRSMWKAVRSVAARLPAAA